MAAANAEREAAIRQARDEGDSFRAIGAEVGLSHVGVQKILAREGKDDGGT